MSNGTTYVDELWCSICDDLTRQTVHDSQHERDSSQDWQRCHRCGAYYCGLTGEWEPAEDTDP